MIMTENTHTILTYIIEQNFGARYHISHELSQYKIHNYHIKKVPIQELKS